MKEVVCINDKNMPEGAAVVKGREYVVIEEFVNNYDQRVYIIGGIVNEGTTKMGLRWIGYDASRFAIPETLMETSYEHAYAEN
jgi:hypothetical protein